MMSGSSTNLASAASQKDALAAMDLVQIVRAYISSAVQEAGAGYKAIVLDKDTMRTVSLLFGRMEMSEYNVVHVEPLHESQGKQHNELKAICFLRPTRENINLLKHELRSPRFQSYHLIFTNIVNNMHLQELAEMDSQREKVVSVHEMYLDFIATCPHHFTIPAPPERFMSSRGPRTATYEVMDRLVQGLSGLFLATRRKPVIRYQRGAEYAGKMAEALYTLIYRQQYQTFDFGARSNPIVLILERKDDPVTPLLMQWTYQAMLHEVVGIDDNKIKLTSPKIDKAFVDIVVDPRQDDFYAKHLYSNYGDVGGDVKDLVSRFTSTQQRHRNVETLEDMRRFVLEHSDFTRLQSNVTKHVNIMTELSEAVARRGLMDMSMAEQEVANPAASLTSAASYDEVMRLLRQPGTSFKDKVALVMLYALRFQADGLRVSALRDYLAAAAGGGSADPSLGEAQRLLGAVGAVLGYAGADKRAGDLYGQRSLLGKARNLVKGLQGVDNVYTQHTPLLAETLAQLGKDNLAVGAYPYIAATQDEALGYQAMFKKAPPREVIVFVIGGTTYEEEKAVAEVNAAGGVRVLLGGTGILNSQQFMDALTCAQ